ncbi:MAG: indolepyruvate ferredoxin oxidoreductase family protein [Candidatus Puniceispirillaceae bacterium]
MAPDDATPLSAAPPADGNSAAKAPPPLESRYTQETGRVFLNGTQALVRMMLDQARCDAAAGLKTGGLVSGYRGSPLATFDVELWRANRHLDDRNIDFLPAVNEDMAATIMAGAQQAEGQPGTTVDGVFGLWYGKGPGVDRSGDAIKHGNMYGSSPKGGVLMMAGDDHGCVSSTISHQSEYGFIGASLPVLNPATISELISFGLFGFALSRHSGLWVGMKSIAELIEAGASVDLAPLPSFTRPPIADSADGLHIRWPDAPGLHLEDRMQAKLDAAAAFAAANPVDYAVHRTPRARIGFVTAGKAHGDLMESLRCLGLDRASCHDLGIDIYKIGMVWPIEESGAAAFMRGKQEIIVVEEKRGIVEDQIRALATRMGSDMPGLITGKTGASGERFIPATGELSPELLMPMVAARLDAACEGQDFSRRAASLAVPDSRANTPAFPQRAPHFCSGCPHNSSTKVPEGSEALAGIGCHFLVTLMDRDTKYVCQMGGEGGSWVGTSRFNGNRHVFQNIGDGTWFHSGSLAIRQAVAAGTNMTFKILYNDAVAMTGGQSVDGQLSPAGVAHSCAAEGVTRIALVSDDLDAVPRRDYPASTSFHDRAEMDLLQRELREFEGVSVLIYSQTCATEKRRRRKRGTLPDPDRHVVINQAVCEGCGDCSVASNCLSVEPVDTPLGRKRRINLSSCNKDFTCLDGFCPSFVTVEGPRLAAQEKTGALPDVTAALAALAPPPLPRVSDPYDILLTGVGGTGVTTIGAVLSMAAHLDGTATTLLNFSGLAQKFGAVMSFVRLAADPTMLHQTRIAAGAADALIGCDMVVSASPQAMKTYRKGTAAMLNHAEMITGEIVKNRDLDLQMEDRITAIARACGRDSIDGFDANRVAEALLGDSVYANMIMLGAAWQAGMVPVSATAIGQAITLNGVQEERNRLAFDIGRLMKGNPELVTGAVLPRPAAPSPDSYEDIVAHRTELLTAYQDAGYAARYQAHLEVFAAGCEDAGLRETVARQLYRMMAYKDEYEVARLHSDAAFRAQIDAQFAPGYRTANHLVIPFLTRATDSRGRPAKTRTRFVRKLFPLLARGKRLRGTALDPFAWQAERRIERGLIDWYLDLMNRYSPLQDPGTWRSILGAAGDIRGFGPVKMEAITRVKAEVETQLRSLDSA